MPPFPPSTADNPRLVLASGSPRRRALLAMAGFDFDVVSPDVDEVVSEGETPEEVVTRLAVEKAAAVLDRVPLSGCVLACDTIVVLDGEILGKPGSADEAVEMLLRLAGRTHRVLTGFVILTDDASDGGVAETLVTMTPVTPAEAEAYAASGEPLDKAGAYGLQGEGKRFVAEVDGSRSNVVGLPLELVVPSLERFGLRRGTREPGPAGAP